MPSLKTTFRVRSLWLASLARVVLLVILGQLVIGSVGWAEEATDPYDTLYDVMMTRYGPDGKSYTQNETTPAIFAWSEFPFDDKTFKKFDAALDAFSALSQEKIEAYSNVQRALLQRHLWKVFDTTFNWDWWKGDWYWGGRKYFPKTRMDRRTATQPKLASLIRRLALTKAQILAIPNPLAATVTAGGFAQVHDPKDRFKPFLPADLYAKESSWICVGEDRHPIPATGHTGKLYARSMFLQFMRLPGGRTETLEYMERVKKKVEQFPVGTQFALIEQPFLISDEGEMVLSPMIVSVQLRAYLDVERAAHQARPDATQCVAEFVMQPREFMKGNAVMRAMTPNDFRYEAGAPFAAGFSPKDPFETGPNAGRMPQTTRLNLCMSCHGRTGGGGVMTRSFRGTNFWFKEISPDEISKATSTTKRDFESWKTLHKLWKADSKKIGKQSSARVDQSQPPLDNEDTSADQPPAAAEAAVSTDEFDELYDVLMVRHARNGEAYGENEITPMIFSFSRFPFDDATYPKLISALNALTPEHIQTYSNVQRAMLQRQLWATLDAAAPSPVLTRRPDDARRFAVRKQLANMIRQLALTRSEIESLPDTLHITVNAKKYPTAFDLNKPTSPFLPADLIKESSGWVYFGRSSTPVNGHAIKSRWRSSFFQLMRLPGGRKETIEYMNRLQLLRLPDKRRTASEYINALEKQEVFPPGTQVALIEKAFLVSDKGEMVLSPMTVGVQLRAYRNVEQSFRDAGTATQCVAEFISRPRDFMRGDGLMTAMSPTDYRLKVFSSDGGKQDVLELVNDPKASVGHRLQQCMRCHGGTGIRSLGDVARSNLKSFTTRSRSEIIKATTDAKRNDESWRLLQTAWDRPKR